MDRRRAHGRPRPAHARTAPPKARRSIRYAKFHYDPDAIDRIARAQTIASESSVKRVPKLRCKACLCYIGLGYYENEVWYDREQDRWICGGCARWSRDEDRFVLLMDAGELAATRLGELHHQLSTRIEEVLGGER